MNEEKYGGRELPKEGEVWRHFKNNSYLILEIAQHTETKELFVIYRRLFVVDSEVFRVYARPLDMFMSEVDRKKYPNVKQKYRFEKVMCG